MIEHVCFFFTCRDDIEHEIAPLLVDPVGRAIVHILLGIVGAG